MADYFLDDAANGTNDGASWATCFNTWAQVNAAGVLTASNRLFVGADANITDPGAALTITGPTSSKPATIISSTVGSGTAVSYAIGTGSQVNTTSGAYGITFDGSFAVYGLRIRAGTLVTLSNDNDELFYGDKVVIAPAGGGNYSLVVIGGSQSKTILINPTFDMSADGTNTRSEYVIGGSNPGYVKIIGASFINAGYRTGAIFSAAGLGSRSEISGSDFSGFPSTCEIVGLEFVFGEHVISNCLTASSWTPFTTGTPRSSGRVIMSNVGPADDPSNLLMSDYFGSLISSSAIYRSSGATAENINISWLITSTANCVEGAPFYTPYFYGAVAEGSKTFTTHITNDSSDFTDAEVWLEVEYLADADEAQWSLISDHRATITATPATQTDDTTSTWNGTGPSFTYKQTLSVTAAVGEAGQYRARVAVCSASIASSRYFYIDPLVTVT